MYRLRFTYISICFAVSSKKSNFLIVFSAHARSKITSLFQLTFKLCFWIKKLSEQLILAIFELFYVMSSTYVYRIRYFIFQHDWRLSQEKIRFSDRFLCSNPYKEIFRRIIKNFGFFIGRTKQLQINNKARPQNWSSFCSVQKSDLENLK